MIKEIFGIPQEPFKRNDPPLLNNQQEIMEILLIHARQGGLNLVAGERGTGKSVLRRKIELLGEEKKEYVVASMQRTMHSYQNILLQIMDSMQLILEKGKSRECEKLIIKEAYRIFSQGKTLITIIDEAHLLDLEVLRKLRLLFDEFPKNHNIILFAQTELLHRISMRVYEDIKTRVTYSARLLSLNPDQIREFILRELQDAEMAANVFDDSAIELIVRSAEGNLRLCRNLCYGSLVEAIHLKQKNVTTQIVNRVLVQPHWRSHDEWVAQGA